MRNAVNHVGENVGIYTISGLKENADKHGQKVYEATCTVCGYKRYATYSELHAPTSIVTHCKHTRCDGLVADTASFIRNRRLRSIYYDVLNRCYDVRNKDYRWYGAKGIKMCDEWRYDPHSFENWAMCHGYSSELTIDRIDPDGNYEPCNCRWITAEENSRRAGKVNWIEVNGTTKTGRQWSQELGLGPNTINRILKTHGISVTKSLIQAMLLDPPTYKKRGSKQTWLSVYGITT